MPPPPETRFERLLRHPRALAVILGLAVLLGLPSLTVGFYADDYAHLSILEGDVGAATAGPLDLYQFVPADRAVLRAFVTRGPLPWFIDPGFKAHLFRPLSSALIMLDHALYGRHAAGYHLTNVLLYGLLVLAAAELYRRALPGPARTTMLATLLFAIDGAHAQPIAWIACRHFFVSAAPAMLGLAAHVRHRRDGFRPGAWLGPLGIAVGLAGSEAALGVVAYWISYDWLGPAPAGAAGARARLRASAPVLALALAYAVVYKLLGYGAAGSGAYLDPATAPLDFARVALERIPALLGDALTGLPSDLSSAFTPAPFIAVGLAATAGVAALYRAIRPAVPEDERAALRWLLPGGGVALVLASAGFVGSRLLIVPGVSGSFLIAVLLHRGAHRVAELGPGLARAAERAGLAALFAVHVVFAPVAIVAGALALGDIATRGRAAADTAEIDGPSPRHVVVVVASDPLAGLYVAMVRAHEIVPRGDGWHVLSMAKHDHRLTRTGPSSFRLEVRGGHMLSGGFEKLLRSPHTPFHVGDTVALQGGDVTVTALDEGLPSVIDARFDVPLEDPHLRVVAWQHGRLARVALPAVGESVDLPWSPGPFRLF